MESPSLDKVYTFGRAAVALYYFFFIVTQVLAALDFLVITTYLRYTDQLKPGMAQSVMDSLRRGLTSRSSSLNPSDISDSTIPDNEDDIER